MEKGFDIVGVGMAVLDILMLTENHPGPDEKVRARQAMPQAGGPCAAALATAARLGASAAYLGVLGGDVYGRFIREELEGCGVNTRHARTAPGLSAHAAVLLKSATGQRTVVSYPGDVPQAGPSDVDAAVLRGAKILHLDLHEMPAARYAARLAKEQGVPVSLDAGSVYPGCEEVLPFVDFLACSETFVRQWSGERDPETGAARLYQKYRPRLFAVTQGPRGGLVQRGGALVRYPAFAVRAVDSNGAGDVFHGALLAGLLRGLAGEEAVHFASAVSALACTRLGARAGVPGWQEAVAFWQAHR